MNRFLVIILLLISPLTSFSENDVMEPGGDRRFWCQMDGKPKVDCTGPNPTCECLAKLSVCLRQLCEVKNRKSQTHVCAAVCNSPTGAGPCDKIGAKSTRCENGNPAEICFFNVGRYIPIWHKRVHHYPDPAPYCVTINPCDENPFGPGCV